MHLLRKIGEMKNDLYIHIPTPCHENWDAMTPEKQGRYCGSCAKTVVDFSVMTDNQMLNYLNRKTGNTCGHFTADQLLRPIIKTQLQPKKTWRYWIASIASLFVLMQKSSGQSQQSVQHLKGDTKVVLEEMKPMILGKMVIPISKKSVSGTIVDEDNTPIAGTSIIIKNTKKGVATDVNGGFTLSTNDNKVTVIISSIGYETKEVILSVNNNKPIVLKISAVTMGEVVVLSYGSTVKGKIDLGGVVAISNCKKISPIDTIPLTIAKVFKNQAFTIYPNPIAKNGTINIAIKEAGNYEVQIFNNQSRLLLSQHHSTASVKQVIQLPVPASALPGVYYIRLINTITKKQWVDKLMIH